MKNLPGDPPEEILIVDDTPANLRLLAQMLSERGFIVRAVTSGARALESLHVTPPDLILLDIRMPEMDGYEVCERIKKDAQTSDIPIIFISALNEIEDKVKGFNVGGVDYITKPFQFEEVLARVETHLSLRKLQKQLEEANKKFERELALAGSLQSSFFPEEPPDIPGWELSVTLKPARETSGDFYDVYALPNGKLGILVADVVDKGAAAALYMALSWTLIRTYAAEFPEEPDKVLSSVNQRIISDTDSSRFVTVFYGVLDPETGSFSYCNAGHNPPLLIRSQNGKKPERLTKTGVLLGMFDDEHWGKESVQFDPGDVLVLYTDGVTEAQNAKGDFFGRERLVKVVKKKSGVSAQVVRESILGKISKFVGDAPQMDDIALVVVSRKSKQ
jgi:sigma-B regulation protein RsbU (phosphoserine phosphatase)